MKRTHLGLQITDIPGVDVITVQPDIGSDDGVHIVFGVKPQSYGVTELRELIGGLEEALRHAEFMIEQNGVPE